MVIYKKIMDFIAMIEKIILAITSLVIVVITVGNVFSRYVIHSSWSWTEELVVALFVLITFVAGALACRDNELVSLSLFTDLLPKKSGKLIVFITSIFSLIFVAILFKYSLDKVITQIENGKRTFVLNWPEWIFWAFVPFGSGCMILHIIENFINTISKKDEEV